MQSERQHGFSLKPDNHSNDSRVRYDDVKDYVEKICHHVEKCSKKYGISNLLFAFRIKSNFFITARMYESGAEFALYRQGERNLIRHATVSELSFLNEQTLEVIKSRIENTAYTTSKNHMIGFGNIEQAWEKEQYVNRNDYKLLQSEIPYSKEEHKPEESDKSHFFYL